MAAPVQLVFFGELVQGFAAADVKRSVGELFQLDEARLAQMFSGSRVVINRSVAAADAPEHLARFARLGARLHIEPFSTAATLAPVQAPVQTPAPPPAMRTAPAASVSAAKPAPALATAAAVMPPLEEEIVCPNCGERQSKRLLCRACATNMPMGIAAKLEAEQEARAAAQAERDTRRGRPAAGAGGRTQRSAPGVSALWGLGFAGRVGRLVYASVGFVLLAVIFLMVLALLKWPGMGGLALFGLGLLLIVLWSVRVSALRLHDFNRSAWWSLLMLVPYLGAVVGLVLSFMPGSREENDFGDPPQGGSWVTLLGSLAFLVACTLVSGSALKSAWAARDTMEWAGGQGLPSEADALKQLRPAAQAAYHNEYVGAPGHKAFAVSPSGAWGWKSGSASLDEAVDGALATCSANRKPYTPECVPVNVDGVWVPFEAE